MRFWFLDLILQEKELELLGEVADSALHACMLSHFSCVQLCVTLWVVAHLASLPMGFFRQGDWSGLLCPPPGESSQPNQHLLCLLHWQADSLPLTPPGKPIQTWGRENMRWTWNILWCYKVMKCSERMGPVESMQEPNFWWRKPENLNNKINAK